MVEAIKERIQFVIYVLVRIEQNVEREEVAKVTGTNKEAEAVGPKKRATAKVGRNDLCPCGSGKKYKFCCGRGEENLIKRYTYFKDSCRVCCISVSAIVFYKTKVISVFL